MGLKRTFSDPFCISEKLNESDSLFPFFQRYASKIFGQVFLTIYLAKLLHGTRREKRETREEKYITAFLLSF